MHSARVLTLVVVLSALGATPAFADLTGFIGADTTPVNHQLKGFAFGAGLLVVGFEFEYASVSESNDPLNQAAPSLTTGMGNILLQTPFAIHGVQPYFTTGTGVYRERLGTHVDTSLGYNTGGGAKISLIGPLRLRVDYRVFKLGSGALYSPAHRIYAGLN